jgi:ferric-dicitrate binding protein FerR (iron transport regulator)
MESRRWKSGLRLGNAAAWLWLLMKLALAIQHSEAVATELEAAASDEQAETPAKDEAMEPSEPKKKRVWKALSFGGIGVGVVTLLVFLGRLLRRQRYG